MAARTALSGESSRSGAWPKAVRSRCHGGGGLRSAGTRARARAAADARRRSHGAATVEFRLADGSAARHFLLAGIAAAFLDELRREKQESEPIREMALPQSRMELAEAPGVRTGRAGTPSHRLVGARRRDPRRPAGVLPGPAMLLAHVGVPRGRATRERGAGSRRRPPESACPHRSDQAVKAELGAPLFNGTLRGMELISRPKQGDTSRLGPLVRDGAAPGDRRISRVTESLGFSRLPEPLLACSNV